MKLPRQAKYGSDRSKPKAWAPYNFVPLPEKVIRRAGEIPGHDTYSPDLLSGYFDVELETKSPVFVRSPSRVRTSSAQTLPKDTARS